MDKEAKSKTFLPACHFPLLGGFKTAKQWQSQTSQQRTHSQSPSPVLFTQLHLPRTETWEWPHLPLSCLWFTALASNEADKCSTCQQKARMNKLNCSKGSIQTTLFKQAILVSIIYYLQHLERVLLLKVTQIPDSHTQRRKKPKQFFFNFSCHTWFFFSFSLTQYWNTNWVPPEHTWNSYNILSVN